MSVVFVDTSAIIAIAFGEPGAAAVQRRLRRALRVHASPLLEAEVAAACRREKRPLDPQWTAALQWIHPHRSLAAEIDQVLNAGYVRGADCWHLATALYATPDPGGITFLTLDTRQGSVATDLGFRV